MHDVVSIRLISQATTATFSDLYIRLTFLFFIEAGSKRVVSSNRGEVVGEVGDVLIFPSGSVVTMENRPLPDANYRAVGVSFTDDLVSSVFADAPKSSGPTGIQIVRAAQNDPMDILRLIRTTLEDTTLPPAIRRHRLLEPLIWLRDAGVVLPIPGEEQPLGKVRRIIERDLGHDWRASEIAHELAMSEATMRRWLSKDGQGFAKILLNTRLEHGLGLLQTTDMPISTIALDCGFKTPAHFSDAFKRRFGIRPKEIRGAVT